MSEAAWFEELSQLLDALAIPEGERILFLGPFGQSKEYTKQKWQFVPASVPTNSKLDSGDSSRQANGNRRFKYGYCIGQLFLSSEEVRSAVLTQLLPDAELIVEFENARYHGRVGALLHGFTLFDSRGIGVISHSEFKATARQQGLEVVREYRVEDTFSAQGEQQIFVRLSMDCIVDIPRFVDGLDLHISRYATVLRQTEASADPQTAVVVCAGTDRSNAQRAIDRIAACCPNVRFITINLPELKLPEIFTATANSIKIHDADWIGRIRDAVGSAAYVCLMSTDCIISRGCIEVLAESLKDNERNGVMFPSSDRHAGPWCSAIPPCNEDIDRYAAAIEPKRHLTPCMSPSIPCALLRTSDFLAFAEGLQELSECTFEQLAEYAVSIGKRALVASNAFVHVPRKSIAGLSLCMIVRDNASIIRRCLESVLPFVDEAIIVDTGSVDETPQICAELGAKVIHCPWTDDFSAARNESLKHASGSWIFWMDSDDVLPVEQGRMLRALFEKSHGDHILGYVMQVHCPSADDEHVTIVDQVKLIRNIPALRFEHRIHEQIIPAIRRMGGDVEFHDIHVVHEGSRKEGPAHQKKLDRDFRLLQLENTERPGHPFVLFNLGMTCENAGKYADGIEYLRQSIAAASPGESHLRKAWSLLASCHQKLGELTPALAAVVDGLVHFPGDPELMFRRGSLNQQKGNLEDAIEAYESVLRLKIPPQAFKSIDPSVTSSKAHFNLAGCYRQLGAVDQAIVHYRLALDTTPQAKTIWLAAAELLLQQARKDQLESLLAFVRSYRIPKLKCVEIILLSYLLVLDKKLPKALELLWKEWRSCNEFDYGITIANLASRDGDWEQEAAILRACMHHWPNDRWLQARWEKARSRNASESG